jgi:hypothetical protein
MMQLLKKHPGRAKSDTKYRYAKHAAGGTKYSVPKKLGTRLLIVVLFCMFSLFRVDRKT